MGSRRLVGCDMSRCRSELRESRPTYEPCTNRPLPNSRLIEKFRLIVYGCFRLSSIELVIAKEFGYVTGKPPGSAGRISTDGTLKNDVNRGAVFAVNWPEASAMFVWRPNAVASYVCASGCPIRSWNMPAPRRIDDRPLLPDRNLASRLSPRGAYANATRGAKLVWFGYIGRPLA